jgi:hypothetical protein
MTRPICWASADPIGSLFVVQDTQFGTRPVQMSFLHDNSTTAVGNAHHDGVRGDHDPHLPLAPDSDGSSLPRRGLSDDKHATAT